MKQVGQLIEQVKQYDFSAMQKHRAIATANQTIEECVELLDKLAHLEGTEVEKALIKELIGIMLERINKLTRNT